MIPPRTTAKLSLHRILYKSVWSDADWTIATAPTGVAPGLRVKNYSRLVLPGVGRALLIYEPGKYPAAPGSDDLYQDYDSPPDLTGYEIRIQAAPNPLDSGSDPEWRTVWWGQCEFVERKIDPGNDTETGVYKYHCFDALHRFKYSPLNKHVWYNTNLASGSQDAECEGHPGYNAGYSLSQRGNKGGIGSNPYQGHAPDGAGDDWTDLETVENILDNARHYTSGGAIVANADMPEFTLSGDSDFLGNTALEMLNSVNEWPVGDETTVYDVLIAIFNRGRGKGLAYLDWEDDSADPLADLVPEIHVSPQLIQNLTYESVTGAASPSGWTVYGASQYGSYYEAIDLRNDERYLDRSLQINERSRSAEYLEIVSEKIQIVITVGVPAENISYGWDTDKESEDLGLPENYNVFTEYHLPWDWNFQCNDASDTSGKTRCDIRCSDSGAIVVPANAPTYEIDTSMLTTRILNDVPIYPGRDDNDSDSLEPLPRSRIAPRVFEDGVAVADLPYVNVARENLIRAETLGNIINGTRTFQTTAELVQFTICLELPHRLRFAYGDVTSPRKKRIVIPGHHLWTAHPDAWYLADNQGETATIADCTTGDHIRDDRDQLLRLAKLAEYWYRFPHVPISFAMRTNGFINDLGDDTDEAGGFYGGPRIGQIIKTVKYADKETLTETPVTKINYDAELDLTTYTTDWFELDYA